MTLVERLRVFSRFLGGEGPIDGDVWWGDRDGAVRFWWRSKHLPVIEDAAARIEQLEGALKDARGRLCLAIAANVTDLGFVPEQHPIIKKIDALLGGKEGA